ncbi:MAG: tripartite tricarboxylate transporter TctB family protein [Rhodospirillales bacterium]
MPWGERVFVGAIGALGLFWISQSMRLPYWQDFAPGSGFLPLWLAIVLVGLVAALAIKQHLRPAAAPAPPPAAASRHGRVAAIMLGLVACILVLEWVGFVAAIGGYLLFLLGAVERRGPAETALVSAGTTLTLFVLFHTWLGVPLPAGPWGF